ncbi:hypothetical protein IFR09_11265 [Pseudomonas syringae]|nr:hypothetical protein [Pseudomonas syringae]MBD8801906.1 hypothetical protein [Pseudomonas syringae]MBD8811744.1 hypothetical protein [Pseudomonas syringae]
MERNELKTISKTDDELRVANYIILFGGRDLTGEFFTPATAIDSNYTKSGILHVDFEHGLDPDKIGMTSDDVLGYVDWKTAKIDDTGVFVERVLNRQAKYMAMLETLIDASMVGTSSQAISGKTTRIQSGEITQWPLMRDTLTFTPAEPRMLTGNALKAAQGLYEHFPESKSLAVVVTPPDLKALIDGADSLKKIEAILRDAGGLSRTDATALVSRIKSLAHGERETEAKTAEIAGLFQQF